MTETRLKTQILNYLRTVDGVFCYKNYGGGYAMGGVPDIIVCFKGQFVALEVKAPKGKTTVLQDMTIEKIRKAAGIASVVYSLDDVKKLLGLHK